MKTKGKCLGALVVIIACSLNAYSDAASAREAFLKQQAYNEMQRVSGQIDVLQTNLGELSARVARLESGNSNAEIDALKAEIASLKATNAELRNKMNAMREEIVRDLTGKISTMQSTLQRNIAASAPRQSAPAPTGPHREYEVQPGDTLSLIAAAFKTTVSKIKEMNNLKSDNIRVGQKLKLPM